MRPSLAARLAAPALGLFLLVGCATQRPASPSAAGAGGRTAVLLAVNDVYRIEGVEKGTVGSMARVRTLRAELEREHPDLLMLHAGDFLFPSFASRMFEGEQMVAALNALDGDTAAFDERLVVVFGNHEFDKNKTKDAAMLDRRIEESQFRWLGSNVHFAEGEDGRPLVDGLNLEGSRIFESGGIRIGIFGITIPTVGVEYVESFDGPEDTARRMTADLRSKGAEVVIALTHLNASDDRDLLENLPAPAGPDLIIGGHDHEHMEVQAGGRWLFKADADARTATVVRLTLRPDGGLRVEHELRPLSGETPRPDPAVQALVDQWQTKHEQAFCDQAKAGPDCLEEIYGRSRVPLVAEESKIRGEETNLGDWIADLMVRTFTDCGAQVAFMNSGSLRLNQDLAAGEITRRQVEELFAYPAPLYLLKIDGKTLRQVAEHATRGWPGSGSWLQVSGFAYVHDQQGKTARQVTLLTSHGARPVGDDETILAVTNDYLINPEIGDQDGYIMLNRNQVVATCAANTRDLKELTVTALKAAEPQGIGPATDGRICQPGQTGPCRAVGN
ncbi:MAG TPA: 5'-nucleotidase C-terminal domain-containing protein [Thermoanaerobaculia bacterium]|nr:5'-nucleotidase C-terminal domain-containing protein [Thermoanaerobaculia bacterium]